MAKSQGHNIQSSATLIHVPEKCFCTSDENTEAISYIKYEEDFKRLLPAHKTGKNEVEQLLGKPDHSETETMWSYRAGASTMDCLSFDVIFDKDGFVVDARLVQH